MSDPIDPFKLRALYGLTDALKQITPGNGYRFDLGDFVDGDGISMQRVFRGRAWYGDSDPIPMLSILEGANPFDIIAEPPSIEPSAEYDWDLTVQGFVNDDSAHPTDPAYRLLAEVRRRLGAEARRIMPNTHGQPDPLGMGSGVNKITQLKFGPGIVRPSDDISAKAWFWLSVKLRIYDVSDQPYD